MKKYLHWLAVPLTVLVLVSALFLTALIPQSAIRENAVRSAEWLGARDPWETPISAMPELIMHYYADDMTVNIAYHIDSEQPIISTLRAAYYDGGQNVVNEYVLEGVRDDLPANQEYMRYWHGTLLVLRPLLLIMDIRGVYLLFSVVLAVLLVLLCRKLWRHGAKADMVLLLIGCAMTLLFLMSLCIEYFWCVFWMLVFSLLALELEYRGRERYMPCMFAVCGIVTLFFDFFSNETLTILVPLLLVLMERQRRKRFSRQEVYLVLRCVIAWGLGFVGMWALKWLLDITVLGASPADFLASHMQDWSVGYSGLWELFCTYLRAMHRNIRCLFPFILPDAGPLLEFLTMLGLGYWLFVHHRSGFDRIYVGLLLALGAIPFLRYIVLSYHSYGHAFFTFRAQLASILAVGAVLIATTQKNIPNRRKQA